MEGVVFWKIKSSQYLRTPNVWFASWCPHAILQFSLATLPCYKYTLPTSFFHKCLCLFNLQICKCECHYYSMVSACMLYKSIYISWLWHMRSMHSRHILMEILDINVKVGQEDSYEVNNVHNTQRGQASPLKHGCAHP